VTLTARWGENSGHGRVWLAEEVERNKKPSLAQAGQGTVEVAIALQLQTVLAGAAAADRGIAERDAALATGFVAGGHAVAAGLQHLAAFLVAAGAGHAAAVFGHFDLAMTAAQIADAHGHAVPHAAAAAGAAGQHLAEVLQSAASDFIIARAAHLEAASALLELHRATRQHAHVRRGRHGARVDRAHVRSRSHPFRHHHRRHYSTPFKSRPLSPTVANNCPKCSPVADEPQGMEINRPRDIQ
jgi:hypothetical protein